MDYIAIVALDLNGNHYASGDIIAPEDVPTTKLRSMVGRGLVDAVGPAQDTGWRMFPRQSENFNYTNHANFVWEWRMLQRRLGDDLYNSMVYRTVAAYTGTGANPTSIATAPDDIMVPGLHLPGDGDNTNGGSFQWSGANLSLLVYFNNNGEICQRTGAYAGSPFVYTPNNFELNMTATAWHSGTSAFTPGMWVFGNLSHYPTWMTGVPFPAVLPGVEFPGLADL